MVRRFALTLFALLLATALPPSPGVAQTGAPPPATTAAATAEPAASEAARVKADADADAKRDTAAAAKTPDVGRIAALLAGVFALAAVIEAALAVIFAWPVFLDRINRRNAKMPISLLVSGVVAWGFDLELVHKLAAAFGAGSGQNLPDWFDALLSALILAGGAAGVRNLMVSLGLATPTAEIEKPHRPPSNKGWLSLRDARADRGTPLEIWLTPEGEVSRVIGVIAARTRQAPGFLRWMVTDAARFPRVAGYAVDVGKRYTISVREGDGQSQVIGIDYAFGEAAIVDLTFPNPSL